MTKLPAFVRSLPSTWATCPIYAKGVKLPDGTEACGKSPLGKAQHEDWSPNKTALHIERHPDTFKAVGVFVGPRSQGLVVFDVDRNLAQIKRKWSKDLASAPCIKSTKKNAAKYLFYVPEEDWDVVSSISHSKAEQEGWEVLWAAPGKMVQAVVGGAYKGGGAYTQEGDFNAIPEAPEWLIDAMKQSYADKQKPSVAKQDPKYATRTIEELQLIAENCLSVIEPQNHSDNDSWWRVGAMLHSALPNEIGLKLWSDWSKKDKSYAKDWENGNPCQDRWDAGFNKTGGLGFGSLIELADQHDPERKRFKNNPEARRIAREILKGNQLTDEEFIKEIIRIDDEVENPAYRNLAKNSLANDRNLREGALAIDKLLDAHLTFERNGGSNPKSIESLDNSSFDYLIPGLLPKPWVLLVHADGGTGKSVMAMTICKHIAQGKSFEVHKHMQPIKKGKILWLNGDQSERILRRQFELIGIESGVDVIGEWDMQWYSRFKQIQKKNKYDLIVIDSLDGCNDSNPHEENRKEYALPLKKLSRRNGVDFPAASIIVLHHNNRTGGFRGTSAIRAAVDETWNMTKLDPKQALEFSVQSDTRLITVEKSRDEREGQQMLFKLMPDYTYVISGFSNKNKLPSNSPNEFMLNVLETIHESPVALCASDLKHIKGDNYKRAIRYALEKLEQQMLIERCAPPANSSFKGRPPVYYRSTGENAPGSFLKRAVSLETNNNPVLTETPSAGTDLIDNEGLAEVDFVKRSGSSTPSEGPFDKNTLLPNPLANEKPCSAGDLNKNADFGIYKDKTERRDEAWNMWDTPGSTTPMSEMDSYNALKDFENCIDVKAQEV